MTTDIVFVEETVDATDERIKRASLLLMTGCTEQAAERILKVPEGTIRLWAHSRPEAYDQLTHAMAVTKERLMGTVLQAATEGVVTTEEILNSDGEVVQSKVKTVAPNGELALKLLANTGSSELVKPSQEAGEETELATALRLHFSSADM